MRCRKYDEIEIFYFSKTTELKQPHQSELNLPLCSSAEPFLGNWNHHFSSKIDKFVLAQETNEINKQVSDSIGEWF